MKRSLFWLLLAATLPPIFTVGGVAAGLGIVKPETTGKPKPTAKQFGSYLESFLQSTEVIYDETVPISDQFLLSVSNAKVDLVFDESLKGQARVKVESKNPKAAKVSIEAGHMSFKTVDSNDFLAVTMRMPVTFASFTANIEASSCQLSNADSVAMDDFTLNIQATECEVALSNFTAEKIRGLVDAGSLKVTVKNLVANDIDWDINAGNLQWNVDLLKFKDPSKGKLILKSATANADIHIGQAPAHSLTTEVNMGSLNMDRAGSREKIAGISNEQRVDGPAGAPEFDIEVQMGKVDFKIDVLVP